MNWDALGAVAEFIGAVAVVATLIYLAVQIGQNSRMMRATIREQRFGAGQELILKLADEAELMTKLAKELPLSEIEETRVDLLMRAMFRLWESTEYQFRHGLIAEDEWMPVREAIDLYLNSSSHYRAFWKNHEDEFSLHLQECVNELLKNAA